MAWADILLNPLLYLPAVLPAIAVVIWAAWSRSVPDGTWGRLFNLEFVLFGLVTGTVYGPQGLHLLIGQANDAVSQSLTWAGILTGLVMLIAIVGAAFAFKQLVASDEFSWLGVGVIAYTLGGFIHVLMSGGEPFATWISEGIP